MTKERDSIHEVNGQLDAVIAQLASFTTIVLHILTDTLEPGPYNTFEPCDKRPAHVSSTALVRYRMNDYSVPAAYGFRDVLVKGFVDEVVEDFSAIRP